MNEFYLPKELINNKQYLLEQQIYQDIYQYRIEDNITLKMLITIILNNNQHLFSKVLEKKTLTKEDKLQLLTVTSQEGDDYFNYFKFILKDVDLKEEELKYLIENAMVSNSLKILNLLFEKYAKLEWDTVFFNSALNKNPSLQLIDFLCNQYPKENILTKDLIEEIFNNDYIDLFKFHTKQQINNDWNYYLHKAISKNAYEIIDYILTKIEFYNNKEEINYYNDFFDYLITEKFEKVIVFLNKIKDLFKLGEHNLEKLLISFQDRNQFELLLFNYKLMSIKIQNEEIKHRVDKYVLEQKLLKKLILKNNKVEIKKI